MKHGFLAAAGLAGFLVLLLGSDLFGLWYKGQTAPFRGKMNAEQQIESAPSRIQRYEEFFALCQGVQTKEDQIDSLLVSNISKREVALTAQQAARSKLINEYNAKSAQAYTAARFKASNLIYQIPRGAYDGTNPTNCIIAE